MQVRAGYSLTFECPQPTPMLLALNIRPERRADLITPQTITYAPSIPAWDYTDAFGNTCTRITAPAGTLTIATEFLIHASEVPEIVPWDAQQHDIRDLPDDVVMFLLGSRYCDTDRLMNIAWQLFGHLPKGWPLVQGILDFVHNHIKFDYMAADATRSAFDGYNQQTGVCRDFAHLAVAFCRCMNIPARYCTGYLGDIRIPIVPGPMDFSAWFEVYLGGHWYTADARHNFPRVGRVLMAMGRDATDVALSTQFGPGILSRFDVITEEVGAA